MEPARSRELSVAGQINWVKCHRKITNAEEWRIIQLDPISLWCDFYSMKVSQIFSALLLFVATISPIAPPLEGPAIGAIYAAAPVTAQPFTAKPVAIPPSTAQSSIAAPNAAETAADPFDFPPKPAIWKLADEDTTIYMFGTIHFLPEKLPWRTAQFDEIVAGVDELVIETTDADFGKSDAARAVLAELKAPATRAPLRERVKPENRATLDEVAAYIDLPLTAIDAMPTWLVPFTVFFKTIESAARDGEYGKQFGVETILQAQFAEMDKPISSIEDSDAVLKSLAGLPDADQLALVDAMLEEWRADKDDKATPDKALPAAPPIDPSEDIAWAKGDIEKLSVGLTKEELGAGFYDILITKRNIAWANWLDRRMQHPGKILLAVGAGHFVGDDALLKYLADKGYVAERIQ